MEMQFKIYEKDWAALNDIFNCKGFDLNAIESLHWAIFM
jgi:hypothetical protein